MKAAGGKRGQIRADINVTPLVDVVLVLLIIFMVVTPLLARGKNVQLPVAGSVETEDDAQATIVLTVTADHQLWLESRRVSEAELVQELKRRTVAGLNQGVLIKADGAVSVHDLRPLLRHLKSAGVPQIAFGVTRPKGGSQ
jgi:biopolymer transport protein TolR